MKDIVRAANRGLFLRLISLMSLALVVQAGQRWH